ncbi:RNA 2',3'-cyclic phosphodiesterase [Thiocystis violascens]|uniref:RNA 2',3'-cyclic phosphodiesterase n=1 Tax=Thiocystis violascens TaxID=73141 RepID=UPI00031EB8B5|nr:RNA 2',3'-cyclic phosphodiesterase [Thiocystis violascens]
MSERWFFALWPDPAVRAALAEPLPDLVPEQARATHPLDLHLTLVFLGELAPDRLRCVESAATDIGVPAFALSLDRLGYFARSQILWRGPTSIPAPLRMLVLTLQTRLQACGIAPEQRAYRPHMTLARKVRAPPPAVSSAPVEWTVSDVVLAAGRGGTVPRYEIRQRWMLDARP